jgi:hypothetical protein
LTSPVLAALANARAQEQAEQERVLTEKVFAHLKMTAPRGERNHWPVWQKWCAQNSVTAFPALPAAVALFVITYPLPDVDAVVGSISIVHQQAGKADPTLSPVVSEALATRLPPIEPPAGWPKERKADFTLLHPGLQKFIVAHERQIIKEMRRAQNEAALARKENTNGTLEQESTAAARADRTDAGADRNETAP